MGSTPYLLSEPALENMAWTTCHYAAAASPYFGLTTATCSSAVGQAEQRCYVACMQYILQLFAW
jgi:hypothetical protein